MEGLKRIELTNDLFYIQRGFLQYGVLTPHGIYNNRGDRNLFSERFDNAQSTRCFAIIQTHIYNGELWKY